MNASGGFLAGLHKVRYRVCGAAQLILAGLLLVLVGGGCGPTAAPEPTAAPDNPLAGTTWHLTALDGDALLEDTYISLTFEEDALGGFAGCNHYGGGPDSGGYTITPGGEMAIPLLARTAMACLEPRGVMEQETAFFEALGVVEAYLLEGDRLSLQNAAGEIVLAFDAIQEFAMEPAALPGTAWRLVSLDGELPLAGSTLTLAFHNEQRAGGYAGCRDYVAGYYADEAGLSFVSTAMMGTACGSEALLRQEEEYTTILGWTARFRFEEDRLELYTVRGEVLAFERLPQAAQPGMEGQTWSLLAFVTRNTAEGLPGSIPLPTDLLANSAITATFAHDQVSGTAGCNQYGGSFKVDGTTLSISDLFHTEMACRDPQEVMAQEQRYLDTLGQATAAQVYGTRLWLETAHGQALVFAAREDG